MVRVVPSVLTEAEMPADWKAPLPLIASLAAVAVIPAMDKLVSLMSSVLALPVAEPKVSLEKASGERV